MSILLREEWNYFTATDQSDSDSSSDPLDSASSLSPSLGRLTRFSSPPPLLLRPKNNGEEEMSKLT